jgi:hypothetical protein
MKPDQLREFFPLLQSGVGVGATVGGTLDQLLSQQWDITPDYVAQRITTIFLNGRAIDDVKTAVVAAGAVIALSGAMPGLVGATMRRGGYYAAMRSGITYQETAAAFSARVATVRLKLFNLLLPELTPGFLQRGIILTASQFAAFMLSTTGSFWRGCTESLVDGTPSGRGLLQDRELPAAGETVNLRVHFED